MKSATVRYSANFAGSKHSPKLILLTLFSTPCMRDSFVEWNITRETNKAKGPAISKFEKKKSMKENPTNFERSSCEFHCQVVSSKRIRGTKGDPGMRGGCKILVVFFSRRRY